MNKIKVMDTNLSNKIAAGEVVETLMNVVKELVENSIDAGSSFIKIDLIESGTKEISVSDDGIGMSREDAVNCLKRHATSKLYTDEDLFHIDTLGFRGEALPSIASVSKMKIETSYEDIGTTVIINGGNIEEVISSSLRTGTKITVKDIFYNTPARLKYLKNLHTELANITSYVTKMALSYPNIKFSLTNNDKKLLSTDGSGNLLKVINSVYGLEVTKKMIKISSENSDYEINGYISYPEINRSSRNFITLFVNGRYVRNNNVIKTILEGYHTYLPIGRYPVVVLNIEADPSIIDVNVHPTKMDIKFSKLEELEALLLKTISDALLKLVLVPEIKSEEKVISNINEITTINKDLDFKEKEVVSPRYEEISFNFNANEEEELYKVEDSKEKKETVNKITPVGIVKNTYIIGENDEGMYIIDQHAGQERINYERYKKKLGEDTREITDVLVPIKLEFTSSEFLELKEKQDIINKVGIFFEEFGQNSVIIRKHPKWLNSRYITDSVRKILEIIISENDFSKEKFNEKIAITLACKMSIKANDYISLEEADKLLETLLKCDNPYTCPHGRPTIINYSYYELEKLFKRAM
ncbi:MAG: DNA mismatch repair endonuclease MutL [Bacilli bacterium]